MHLPFRATEAIEGERGRKAALGFDLHSRSIMGGGKGSGGQVHDIKQLRAMPPPPPAGKCRDRTNAIRSLRHPPSKRRTPGRKPKLLELWRPRSVLRVVDYDVLRIDVHLGETCSPPEPQNQEVISKLFKLSRIVSSRVQISPDWLPRARPFRLAARAMYLV